MKTANNIFVADLNGIRELGVSNWLEGFRGVLPGDAYQNCFDNVSESFQKALPERNETDPVYWAIVANYKCIYEFSEMLFRLRFLSELARTGYTHIAGDPELPLEDALSGISEVNGFKRDIFRRGLLGLLREKYSNFRTNLKRLGPCRSIFEKPFSAVPAAVAGSWNQKEILNYEKNLPLRPVCTRPGEFYSAYLKNISPDEQTRSEVFAKTFFDEMLRRCPEASDVLNEQLRLNFSDFTAESVSALNAIRKGTLRWKKGDILITPIGNIHLRLMAAAIKMNGGKSLGFTHGNAPFSCLPTGMQGNGSFLVLNKFVTACEGERNITAMALKNYRTGLESPDTELCFSGESLYKGIFEKLQAADIETPQTVHRIMIIGFPMDYNNYASLPLLNTFSMLHLELRLASTLKKLGFEVLYKAHPDTLHQIHGLFEDRVDGIETGRFEDCYSKCDCVLFPHQHSSTFGFAMMSKIPVVLLHNTEWTYYPEEVLSLIRRRCGLVKIEASQNGIIEFEPQALDEALRSAPSRMDYEIVRKYAL